MSWKRSLCWIDSHCKRRLNMLLRIKIWKSKHIYQNCYIFNRKKIKTSKELSIHTPMIVLRMNTSRFKITWEWVFVIHFHIYWKNYAQWICLGERVVLRRDFALTNLNMQSEFRISEKVSQLEHTKKLPHRLMVVRRLGFWYIKIIHALSLDHL